MIDKDTEIIHSVKCGGIPMYLTQEIYYEMRANLNDEELESYKRRVVKFWGFDVEFPWNDG